MTFEQVARRLRLPLGFVLAAVYLAFGPRPTPLTLAVGGGLALIGVVVRGWAAGHIVKNDRLATTGPYAHTRNPLYFGSFLIAAGFAVAAHWSLLLVVVAFFALVYGPTIEKERANISARFPEAYELWQQNVPARHREASNVYATFPRRSITSLKTKNEKIALCIAAYSQSGPPPSH